MVSGLANFGQSNLGPINFCVLRCVVVGVGWVVVGVGGSVVLCCVLSTCLLCCCVLLLVLRFVRCCCGSCGVCCCLLLCLWFVLVVWLLVWTTLRRTPLRRTAQNFALFFPLPSPCRSFLCLSGCLLVDFWWRFRRRAFHFRSEQIAVQRRRGPALAGLAQVVQGSPNQQKPQQPQTQPQQHQHRQKWRVDSKPRIRVGSPLPGFRVGVFGVWAFWVRKIWPKH